MNLRPVESESLADKVFSQLLAEIVSGAYPSGAVLPSERTMTNTFVVSRHVVREAVKRLEQIGLVCTAQGDRTRVLDLRQTAGLDLLSLIAEHADALEGLQWLLRDAIEMRAGIGQDVARLCATRAAERTRREIAAAAEELAGVQRGPEILPLDQRFWQVTLRGADNLAYQLAFNSLIRGVNALPDFSQGWLEAELARSGYRRPLAAAIVAGDPDAAAAAARDALTPPPEVIAAFDSAAQRGAA